jgi:hypothetical protein
MCGSTTDDVERLQLSSTALCSSLADLQSEQMSSVDIAPLVHFVGVGRLKSKADGTFDDKANAIIAYHSPITDSNTIKTVWRATD